MRPITTRIVSAAFLLMLILPPLSILLPASATEIENRPIEFPEVTGDRLFDLGFYRQAFAYVRDANPVRTALIRAATSLDFSVFDDSPNPTRVFKGSDDWLFFRETVDQGCSAPPDVVAKNLQSFVARLAQDVETVVVTVPPSKYTIHPEQMTPAQFRLTECARNASDRLRAHLADWSFEHYVDSWTLFTQAKADGMQPYFRTDTHFTFEASIGWMKALIDEIGPFWDESATRNEGPMDFDGNLMTFLALTMPERVDHHVVRREVTMDVDTSLPGRATRYRLSGGDDVALVPGRTIVIGDSFMVIPEPSLVQYFEDATVLDWRQPDAVDYFFAQAPSADTVIVEVSELDIWQLFGNEDLLDRYPGS